MPKMYSRARLNASGCSVLCAKRRAARADRVLRAVGWTALVVLVLVVIAAVWMPR